MAAFGIFFSFVLLFCLHRSSFASEAGSRSSVNLDHRSRRARKDNCIPTIEDHQKYYSLQNVTGVIDNYWTELQDESKHHTLPQGTVASDRVNLTFGFPFYGLTIKSVFLTTAGILSMSPDLDGTTISHYIAPYLGHFSPGLSEDSAVYFESIGDKFVVEWRNVYLHFINETALGPFQFQTIVHRNGTILFLYKKLPSDLEFGSSMIGLESGIEIKQKDVNATVKYQGIDVDESHLNAGTVVIFTPLSICDLAKDSQTCTYEDSTFYCKDCKVANNCSDETEGLVEQWLRSSCKYETPAGCKIADCVPNIQDHQQYYTMRNVMGVIDSYWIELQNESKHQKLSQGTAASDRVNLTFGFPFYGQTIKHVFLTTAGVLSMSPDLDSMPVSHWIAPYLSHFTTSHSEDSAVYFESIGDKFVVEWRNVYVPFINETALGPFQFQTIVHRNGTILFLYKKLPLDLAFRSSMIGFEGGIDIVQKDIKATVNYQAIDVDESHLSAGTVVIFTPFSICDLAKDSQTCTSEGISFYCKHCDVSKHCSDETGRQLQQWLRINCKNKIPVSCKKASPGSHSKTIAIVVVIAVVLVLLSVMGGWFYYAYTRPNTPSGRWLIEHRPSQWLGLILKQKGSSNEDQESTSQGDDDPGY